MNKDPEIRRAVSSDANSIRKCVEAAYRHYIDRIGKPPGPMLDDYHAVIRHHTVFVAESDDIIGVLVLVRSATDILLDNVAVHPDHQGKGLGMRLINLAESEAIDHGYTAIDLYTHECMTENIERYNSLGYVETVRKKVRGYSRVYMRKSLLR